MNFNFIKYIFVIFLVFSCKGQGDKIDGISFVASPHEVKQEHIAPVLDLHSNYAAIMPFGFLKSLEHTEIVHNTDRQWFGETRAGAKQYIEELTKKQIKIMIKPQIWVWNGEFTGLIKMKNEADWKLLEKSYTSFILEYVQLAQEVNVEIFCIGTELENFVKNRPEYWNDLIKEIRKIYSGKLTYAANWDEYKRTPFWNQLDYVGVDAYFPLSESKTPTVTEAKLGWQKWKKEMHGVSQAVNKPILFTEYGYRSVDFSGKEPWVSDHTITAVNFDAQTNLTQALFDEMYHEDWYAGGFIWKWFIEHDKVGGFNDSQFTPQNKPVQKLIKKQFKVIH